MHVVSDKNLGPKLRLTALDKITSLLLEHRVVVGDSDQLVVTESFGIRDVCQVRIASFAELSDYQRLVELQRLTIDEQTYRIENWRKDSTLFSLRKVSGLLLLSI